ncbi:hypothetical protein KOR42_29540 [Thalassoglobus neptunius]|uniref:Uncharacterized protein n=1 Tax=Thalassoglobus neptunius TaxID=1938619 RepID=A0A5C5WX82_9PLAN|nr:hypothetical protein KOR42_29540 [Thalassoglobus neptunius]
MVAEVVSLSMRIARKYLAPYSHRNSPKKFTQEQLITCLILKAYLNKSKRTKKGHRALTIITCVRFKTSSTTARERVLSTELQTKYSWPTPRPKIATDNADQLSTTESVVSWPYSFRHNIVGRSSFECRAIHDILVPNATGDLQCQTLSCVFIDDRKPLHNTRHAATSQSGDNRIVDVIGVPWLKWSIRNESLTAD